MAKRYKRIGRFYLTEDVEINPFFYSTVFEKIVVLRAETDFMRKKVEYFAAGEMFDPIELGAEIPEYTVTHHADGREATWSKVV